MRKEAILWRPERLPPPYRQTEAADMHSQTVIREAHHRIKNHLQIISSIVLFESLRSDQTVHGLAESVLKKLKAISAIHETLYQSDTVDAVVASDLLAAICTSISDTHKITTCADADIVLAPDQASPLGMVVNEAVCNALKHAFPEGRSGQIAVTLRRAGDDLVLTVSDDGVGFSRPAARVGSIGRQLVSAFAAQLGGDCRYTTRDGGGTVCTVTFHHARQE